MSKPINVQSMVTAATREPAVMLRLGEEFVTIPTTQAREIATMLVYASEAAEQDAFFLGFMMDRLDCTEAQAVAMLREFREHRSQEQRDDG